MTLIKSILLGSAAGIVAVASAQAADLPTHKAAPVGICQNLQRRRHHRLGPAGLRHLREDLGLHDRSVHRRQPVDPVQLGRHGPQSRTAIAAQIRRSRLTLTTLAAANRASTQRVLIAASAAQQQHDLLSSRRPAGRPAPTLGFDFASNTAYGPLIGHIDIQDDIGNGFDSLTGPPDLNIYYINQGYLTWAGITAGKAASFYSFTGGGDNWANFFSPGPQGLQRADADGLHRLVRRRLLGDHRVRKPGLERPVRRRHPDDRRGRQQPRQHHLRRPALARHRRRLARQAGLGRGPGLRRAA